MSPLPQPPSPAVISLPAPIDGEPSPRGWSCFGVHRLVSLHILAWVLAFAFYPLTALAHLFGRSPWPVLWLSLATGALLAAVSLALRSRLIALVAATNLLVIPGTILSLVYLG